MARINRAVSAHSEESARSAAVQKALDFPDFLESVPRLGSLSHFAFTLTLANVGQSGVMVFLFSQRARKIGTHCNARDQGATLWYSRDGQRHLHLRPPPLPASHFPLLTSRLPRVARRDV